MRTLAGFETGTQGEISGSSGASIISSGQRTGNYALKLENVDYAYHDADNHLRTRGYFKISSLPSAKVTIFKHYDTVAPGDLATIQLDTDGTLIAQVFGGSEVSGAIISAGVWVQIKTRYTNYASAGWLEWWVDTVSQDTATGNPDMAPDTRLYWYGPSDEGETIIIDDFVSSTASSEVVDDGQIEALRPDGDSGDTGEDTFVDEGADGTTWDNVDDDPLNEATYATKNGTAQHQLWTLKDTGDGNSISGTINHMRIGAQLKRGNGGGTTHHLRSKKSGGSSENSADLGLGTASAYYTYDPVTQPASAAELDSWQAGASINGTRYITVYDEWVMVDYTPAPPPGGARRRILVFGTLLLMLLVANPTCSRRQLMAMKFFKALFKTWRN